jgi:glycosyltransferase involved in cell wall biosynthesis
MKILLVIPVYNEEQRLPACLATLCPFLSDYLRLDCELVIADNGSTDRTFELGRALARQYSFAHARQLSGKGRGRALKQVWLDSDADILSYMDVDLSTDLGAYPVMLEALAGGLYDLAMGSRQSPASHTTRSLRRECFSRGYNWLVRRALHTGFADSQCGFKAITRQAARELLPLVEDTGWFFDTELLVLAEKLGYRIFDLPVRWVENTDSRVKLLPTAIKDIRNVIRLRHDLANGKYVGHRNCHSSLAAAHGE